MEPKTQARAPRTDHAALMKELSRRGGMRYDPQDMRYIAKRPPNAFEIIIPLSSNDGKRNRTAKRVIGTHRDAWFVRNALLEELVANETALGSGTAHLYVRDVIEKYLTVVAKSSTKERTYDGYCMLAKLRLIPVFGDMMIPSSDSGKKPTDFSAERFETIRAQWLVNGKYQTKRNGKRTVVGGMSKGTANTYTRLMKTVFKHAYRPWHMTQDNLMEGVKLFNEKKPQRGTYSFGELYRLFESAKLAKTTRPHALVLLATFTGSRKGELFGLSWRRIDFEECSYIISDVMVHTSERGAFIVDTPKTKSSERKVFWNKGDDVDLLLHELHKEYLETKVKLGAAYDKRNLQLVFANHIGEPLNPGCFNKSYSCIAKRAGLKHIAFHDLRHTFATLARSLEVRADMDDIQKRLGHASAESGRRMSLHYAHHEIEHDRLLQRLFQAAYDRHAAKAIIAA
jgi:integrase